VLQRNALALAWVGLVGLIASPGCGPPPASWPVREDLVALLPVAERLVETERVDFGEPEARDHLLAGWSWEETYPLGSFVWALGSRSSLWIHVAEPGPRTLVLTGWSLDVPDVPTQRVGVRVNGVPVGEIEMERSRHEYRIPVAGSLLRAGRNRIELAYSYALRAGDVLPTADEDRPLAAAWDELLVEGARAGPAPDEIRADASSLQLPGGAEVDYYVWARPGDVLHLAGLDAGGNGARLEVELEPDRDPVLRRTIAAPSEALVIPVGVDEPQAVRVGLRARPGADGAPLRVLEPTLRGRSSRPTSLRPASLGRPTARRPSVILYVVDTLRADHLPIYGYARPTAPNLDALARDALVFEAARAESSWTRPALASILTGLAPRTHGVNGRANALPAQATTLAELLHDAGYETRGYVTNGNVAGEFGFDQGFDRYVYWMDETDGAPADEDDSGWLVRRASEWLRSRRDPRPFFLYLHAIAPHSPYAPPERQRAALAASVADPAIGGREALDRLEETGAADGRVSRDLAALYDAEVAAADEGFGSFLEELRRLGLYDDALLVFVSDHGEEFLDHGGLEHGRTLYVEQLHVPLLIKLPGGVGGGRRVPALARQIDLLPTLLDFLDLPIPPQLEGRSLRSVAFGAQGAFEPPIASAYLDVDQRRVEALRAGDLELVETLAYDQPHPRYELFDVRADPREAVDLAMARPVALGYLRQLLRGERVAERGSLEPQVAQIGDPAAAQLRALGYLR
jgi:arylsulfatase A-like enzyme